tara:strand:- start:9363 stop:10499 length:1137 start_codon:yes stop_codon:yes gene_type:complete
LKKSLKKLILTYKYLGVYLNHLKGKIINHNDSFFGEVKFEERINHIDKINDFDSDNYIVPGFVDLHCHGGNGFDTMEGLNSIKNMSKYHLSRGTTTLLATTWTSSFDHTYEALKDFNSLINVNSNLIGVHLEGPFINPNKLGAQPPLTQIPSIEFIEKIISSVDVKVITLAPEIDGMNTFIPYLKNKKINIQFGHSLADYNCCIKYMNDFKIGFTHLYNAMSGNDSRNPGVLSAALEKSEFAEIICDLNHVSPQSINIANKCIPKLYAVSDCIAAGGLKDGDYVFANSKISKKNDKITLINSSTLAGSGINMHKTFLNLLNIDYSPQEAVAMTSYNASNYLKLNDLGLLKEGYKSNFLVLDKNYNIKEIYLNGKKIKN